MKNIKKIIDIVYDIDTLIKEIDVIDKNILYALESESSCFVKFPNLKQINSNEDELNNFIKKINNLKFNSNENVEFIEVDSSEKSIDIEFDSNDIIFVFSYIMNKKKDELYKNKSKLKKLLL